jgi:PEGA domain
MSHAPWARIGDRWTGGELSYGPKYFCLSAQRAGASADTGSVARAAGPLIHLGTRCGSVEEFVARFAPFATDTSLVMPTASEVATGTEGRFVIHLKDRTPVMSGRCRVEEVRPVESGGGRMVMRVRLLGMDEPSRKVHRQLLAFKRPAPAPAPVVAKPPPLRIVRAPTLIGAAAPPIGTAPTLIGTLAPPLPAPAPLTGDELEKTMESIKVPEVQAPSAAFTLPANPLSDLEAGDLSSFIECTLFEADGDLEASPERAASDEAKTPHALVEDGAVKPATPEVSRSDASVGDVAPHAQLRHRLMQAAPYALCTVIGVLVGAILRTSPPPPRAAREPQAVAVPAIVVPPVIAPIAPAPTAPAPERAPTPIAARPSGACAVSVTTEPPDAVVLWGAQELGHTPLTRAVVPCGGATMTLRHERYRDIKRPVTAQPARTLVIDERLRRPMGTLMLTSSPARATFTVNQQALGPGPRKLSTWRFETVHVEATLPGYLPWKRTFYFKEEMTKLNAQLVSAKPEPHGAARGPFRR